MTGENATVEKIVDELAMLGIERTEPAWSAGKPPDFPRGIGPSKLANPRWNGSASERKRAAQAKRDYATVFNGDEDTKRRADVLCRELRAGLRSIDEAHNTALWTTVREAFDYPVFIAAPKTVGISSTGETGENVPDELPQLLDAYHTFETWVEAGAIPENVPDFHLPSVA